MLMKGLSDFDSGLFWLVRARPGSSGLVRARPGSFGLVRARPGLSGLIQARPGPGWAPGQANTQGLLNSQVLQSL